MTTEAASPRALIIHGYGADPDDHWFGWLAGQLRARGMTADVPALPAAPEPQLWERTVASAIGQPDADTAVVAHSLGCLTVLRVLRHLDSLGGPWRLGTLVLVAGFVDTLPALPELDGFIGDDGFDADGLDDRIDRIVVFRSDADRLVPTSHTDHLAGLLGTGARVVVGAGHFLGSDGITALPEVLEALEASTV